MNFFKLFFAALTVSLTVGSCSKDSDFDTGRQRAFALYKMVYDGTEKGTLITAEFFDLDEKGPKLDLGGLIHNARVTITGKEAEYKHSTFTFYREFANKQTSSKIVYFFTKGNLELNNTITLPKDIALPAGLNTINRANGLKFKFGGDPVSSRETVRLVIGSKKFELTTQGSNEFDLTSADLSSIPAGTAVMHIERERWTEASQATTAGGKLVGINRSQKRNVTVL